MRILDTSKLKKCGYQTNKKGNAIYPLDKKSYSYATMFDGFLIVVNNYKQGCDERTKKEAIRALIHELGMKNAIIYNSKDLKGF